MIPYVSSYVKMKKDQKSNDTFSFKVLTYVFCTTRVGVFISVVSSARLVNIEQMHKFSHSPISLKIDKLELIVLMDNQKP